MSAWEFIGINDPASSGCRIVLSPLNICDMSVLDVAGCIAYMTQKVSAPVSFLKQLCTL